MVNFYANLTRIKSPARHQGPQLYIIMWRYCQAGGLKPRFKTRDLANTAVQGTLTAAPLLEGGHYPVPNLIEIFLEKW